MGKALGLVGEGALPRAGGASRASINLTWNLALCSPWGLRAWAWTGYKKGSPAASIPNLALHPKKKRIYSPVSELTVRNYSRLLFKGRSNLDTNKSE